MPLTHALLVAAGGAAGSLCRHFVGLLALRWFGPNFPVGTLAVNIVGSLAMGLFVGLLAARGGDTALRLLVATGFLGGFTTLSSFALDTVVLWERGATLHAAGYVAATLIFSIAGLVAGLMLVRTLT